MTKSEQNQAFHDTIMTNSGIWMNVHDAKGVILEWNKAAENISGYLSEEVIGSTDIWQRLYPDPAYYISILKTVNDIVKKNEVIEGFVTRIWTKNNEYRYIQWSSRNFISSGQDTDKTLSIGVDITDSIHAEEKLKELNYALEENINRQIEELDRAKTQLIQEDKMVAIGQLAAGVAHEINNPLGFVLSNMDILNEYLTEFKTAFKAIESCVKKADFEKICDEFDDIKKAHKINYILNDLDDMMDETLDGLSRIRRIVKSLRSFAHKGAQDGFSSFDINESIEDTLIIASNETKFVTEVRTVLGKVPLITANVDRINQVILNLIINATHAIKDKGENYFGNLLIETYVEKPYVVLKITDDGIGIPEENMSHIFNPFFTTKPQGVGTGLGLHIVYDIVITQHSGKIDVESKVGEGTTFTIKLPIVQEIEE